MVKFTGTQKRRILTDIQYFDLKNSKGELVLANKPIFHRGNFEKYKSYIFVNNLISEKKINIFPNFPYEK